ncbi:hypothetical protein WA026_021053 [Henosepilachna vigintioctopunctata]|uniref:Uncharacterized protein n=1 Tax=Henosepilachna vigintioctopunctata TaxID=420089 RepID=A0AAW1V4X1_9CUCU
MVKFPNSLELVSKFKKHKNKLEQLIRQTKTDYYRKQIDKNKDNSRGLWNIVNEAKETKIEISEIENIQGDKLIKEKREIANEFNKYFSEIGVNLAKKIGKTPENEKEVASMIKELKKKNPLGGMVSPQQH